MAMIAEIYLELRDLIIRGDPHVQGWAPSPELPHVWGALVEVGLPEGPATVVSLVDGTTSLYLGNGAATIGAGEAATVADLTRRLLVAVEGALPDLHPVWEFPVPARGEVRVVALTYAGPMGAHAPETDVATGTGPLAAVYAASSAVLDGIRRLDDAVARRDEPTSVREQLQ
jgi:hypothetical protein